MNIKCLFLIGFMHICFAASAQNKNIAGYYSFESGINTSRPYYESLLLNEDGSFKHESSEPFFKLSVIGNWQVRNDSLVLDSYPQKDKLIVWEKYKKGGNTTIIVRNKSNELFTYYLFVITDKNDTITIRDQWDKTILKEKIVAFYLACSGGLYSPIYKIVGGRTNYFEVFFEMRRVYENELWEIKNEKIRPKGLDNKDQSYFLTKQKNLN
jgi:hypothetical protein